MTKVQNLFKKHLHKINLSVDSYTEREDGVLICHCFTPGYDEEDGCPDLIVTMDELQNKVCYNGQVICTFENDTQETESLTFGKWYDDNRHSDDMHLTLADIINKKQGRKPIINLFPMAKVDEAMGKLNKVINTLNPAKTA